MQIHGSSAFVDGPGDITVDLNAADPEFVFVKVGFPGGVYMTVYGDGDADTVITKFLQAKDMLAAHRHAVACRAGIGEYVNGPGHIAEAGSCNTHCPHGGECSLPAGHPGDHTSMAGGEEMCRFSAAQGLPVAEDDGGDGDDNREPYCTVCLFTLDAAGEHHLYPDDAIVAAHETVLGWREPVGVPSGEDAQSAEVRRIGKLHTDGHITAAECAELVDKALGEHA